MSASFKDFTKKEPEPLEETDDEVVAILMREEPGTSSWNVFSFFYGHSTEVNSSEVPPKDQKMEAVTPKTNTVGQWVYDTAMAPVSYFYRKPPPQPSSSAKSTLEEGVKMRSIDA